MTVNEIENFLTHKQWYTVEIVYMHREKHRPPEVRTTYYRTRRVRDAVEWFDTVTDPDEDTILSVTLDNSLYGDED